MKLNKNESINLISIKYNNIYTLTKPCKFIHDLIIF